MPTRLEFRCVAWSHSHLFCIAVRVLNWISHHNHHTTHDTYIVPSYRCISSIRYYWSISAHNHSTTTTTNYQHCIYPHFFSYKEKNTLVVLTLWYHNRHITCFVIHIYILLFIRTHTHNNHPILYISTTTIPHHAHLYKIFHTNIILYEYLGSCIISIDLYRFGVSKRGTLR